MQIAISRTGRGPRHVIRFPRSVAVWGDLHAQGFRLPFSYYSSHLGFNKAYNDYNAIKISGYSCHGWEPQKHDLPRTAPVCRGSNGRSRIADLIARFLKAFPTCGQIFARCRRSHLQYVKRFLFRPNFGRIDGCLLGQELCRIFEQPLMGTCLGLLGIRGAALPFQPSYPPGHICAIMRHFPNLLQFLCSRGLICCSPSSGYHPAGCRAPSSAPAWLLPDCVVLWKA